MQGIGKVVAGFLAGSIVTGIALTATTVYKAVDAGITHSYRCDQLDWQASERDILHNLATLAFAGMDAKTLEDHLKTAGLFEFHKVDNSIVAGHEEERGLVAFILESGTVKNVVISGIDGRCSPPQGGN